MPKYDLCLIRSDGRIDYVVPLRAADDAEAVAEAERHESNGWRELWIGSQLIWRRPPTRDPTR